jgi:hypothetical protein
MKSEELRGKGFIIPSQHYNEHCVERSIRLIMRDKTVHDLKRGRFGVHINAGDKEVHFVLSRNMFTVKKDCVLTYGKNRVFLKSGMNISPWSFYVIIEHKYNEPQAVLMYQNESLKKKPPFIFVGDDYYELDEAPDRDGIVRKGLLKRKEQTIKKLYGDEVLEIIPKFKKFGIFPSNKDWKEQVYGAYNQYAPFGHKALESYEEDNIKWSMMFMKHIFGEQIDLGLKYMQILYQHPKQMLPILALLSGERETGKSTFGFWLGVLYGENKGEIKTKDIGEKHNDSWALKNIIVIEEMKGSKTTDLESLKGMVTARDIVIDPKFVTPYSIPFYGKVVIMSNHTKKFANIDEEEIRYWVVNVPPIEGKKNSQILKDLTDEIPAFLSMLDSLPEIEFDTGSRMYFTAEEINTDMLKKTQAASISGLRKDINIYLKLYGESIPSKKNLYFTLSDLYDAHWSRNNQISISYLEEVIKDEMKLTATAASRYIYNDTREIKTQVRCYSVPNLSWNNLTEEDKEAILQDQEDDEVPF